MPIDPLKKLRRSLLLPAALSVLLFLMWDLTVADPVVLASSMEVFRAVVPGLVGILDIGVDSSFELRLGLDPLATSSLRDEPDSVERPKNLRLPLSFAL